MGNMNIEQNILDDYIELHNLWQRSLDGLGTQLDCTDMDLSGMCLRGADLRDSIMCRANLHGADLRGVDLSGAILKEANLEFCAGNGKEVISCVLGKYHVVACGDDIWLNSIKTTRAVVSTVLALYGGYRSELNWILSAGIPKKQKKS